MRHPTASVPIGLYAGNIRDGHATVRLEEARAHRDETCFMWIGDTDEAALDGPCQVRTRRHVHTVVRTPNGNDCGKDLLRRHCLAVSGDSGHGHASR